MKQRMPWLFCIFFVLCLTKCGEPLPDAESAGARLYQGRCSGCHRLYHPRLLTIGMWKQVQAIVLANEGTLVSECGRLMGRLDLLVADIDENGKSIGWIVADLKTGRPPKVSLNEKVSRQLRFYRDLLKENNPDHPPLHAEGWYSSNQTIHRAEGPSVLEDAFVAWEGMRHSETPFEGTPDPTACGFCEWKAWCPTWWVARRDGILPPGGIFRDEVVNIIRLKKLIH